MPWGFEFVVDGIKDNEIHQKFQHNHRLKFSRTVKIRPPRTSQCLYSNASSFKWNWHICIEIQYLVNSPNTRIPPFKLKTTTAKCYTILYYKYNPIQKHCIPSPSFITTLIICLVLNIRKLGHIHTRLCHISRSKLGFRSQLKFYYKTRLIP